VTTSQNYDDSTIMELEDTSHVFYVIDPRTRVDGDAQRARGSTDARRILAHLQESWASYDDRSGMNEDDWVQGLGDHLERLVTLRLAAIETWMTKNSLRFLDADASMGPLRRDFNQMANDVRASIQMCLLKCSECHLKCLSVRSHEGVHDCATSHQCRNTCLYMESHQDQVPCGMPYVALSSSSPKLSDGTSEPVTQDHTCAWILSLQLPILLFH
jgi:hypothetical protein